MVSVGDWDGLVDDRGWWTGHTDKKKESRALKENGHRENQPEEPKNIEGVEGGMRRRKGQLFQASCSQ